MCIYIFLHMYAYIWASQVIKNPPASARDMRDVGLIPGSKRCPGGWHGNPPRYSCLGNPMDRGAQWFAVHAVIKSQTQLSTHSR